jgi:hypothetical protein
MLLLSSVQRRISESLNGKRIDSRALKGINSSLADINFSINVPSKRIKSIGSFTALFMGFIALFTASGSTVIVFYIAYKVLDVVSRSGAISSDGGKLLMSALFLVSVLLLLYLYRSIYSIFLLYSRRIDRAVFNSLEALHDARSPILFLRSFSTDSEEDGDRTDHRTPEELIIDELKRNGPVIAVGNPGDTVRPVLGAVRLYLEEDWKSEVHKLLAVSRIVVIEADVTPGAFWELQCIRKVCNPRKVVVSFHTKQDAPNYVSESLTETASFERFYDNFSSYFLKAFGNALPEYHPDNLLICFGGDWNPFSIRGLYGKDRPLFKFGFRARKPKRQISSTALSTAFQQVLFNLNEVNPHEVNRTTKATNHQLDLTRGDQNNNI